MKTNLKASVFDVVNIKLYRIGRYLKVCSLKNRESRIYFIFIYSSVITRTHLVYTAVYFMITNSMA